MQLYLKIKKYRIKNKMTQQNLANKLNVSRKTISSWENNRNKPDLEMIKKISSIFNVPLNSLINAESYRQSNKKNKSYIEYDIILITFYLNLMFFILCTINLVTTKIPGVVIFEIMIECIFTYHYNKKYGIKITKNISLYIILIIVYMISTLIQIDKIYTLELLKNNIDDFAYILSTLLHSFIITYSLLIILEFSNIKES
jgi:DNA-binding XRE family transcriptional regulator